MPPARRAASWMLPEAKHVDLLYASIQTTCCATSGADVDVFSYPKGKLVGQLNVPNTMFGLCSDSKGDVFVTGFDTSASGASTNIYEYRHGETTPVATLYDPWSADACSVDPTTGNLAVANWYTGGSKQDGNLLIYDVASGKYAAKSFWQIRWYKWCAYDANGDLYVDGEGGEQTKLAVLPKGHHSWTRIFLSDSSFTPYSLQPYRDELIIADYELSAGPETLAEVKVSKKKGTIVHTITLKDSGSGYGADSQFVIQGSRVIGGGYPGYELNYWRYRDGGEPLRQIAQSQGGWWYGLAISTFARKRLR